MTNFYINQDSGYGMGNFIMLTPAIRGLSDLYDRPIPVHFHDKYMEPMFKDCPFMTIIDKPIGKKLFGSGAINKAIPDWEYVYKKFIENTNDIPHTYVDSCEEISIPIVGDYAVIIRGTGGDAAYTKLKDPGNDIYHHILKSLNIPKVFIGSTGISEDWARDMSRWTEGTNYIRMNDIRMSLSLINNAKFVISNDTGMYHAAGALNKNQFVLWKDTNLIKNSTPSIFTTFSKKDDWYKDFNIWVNQK